MKYNISIFVLVFCLASCQKNIDNININSEFPSSELILTTDLTLTGGVSEHGSTWHWTNLNFQLANVNVQLMFNGEILDETNTDETGLFAFPTQPVPDEGAYLLFESPGYYNNMVKVDAFSNSIYDTNLLRKTFPNISGEVISGGGPYIKLKGTLQNPTEANNLLYYITNATNELIGSTTSVGDLTDFTITTLADEELFLHYQLDCYPDGAISLGSFSEDTDLGVLLDQSFDFSKFYASGFFSTIYDCPGNEISEYSTFFKRNGLTTHSWGTAGFSGLDCDFLVHPIIVTLATQNPRKYQEKIIDYSQNQSLFFDMTICTDDDTFIKYTIDNGAEITPDLFTYANVLPTGELLLKQKDPDYDNGTDITFIISNANVGSNSSDVIFYNGFTTFLNGNGVTTTIVMNDGEFVEGTFSGVVFDGYEVSLGTLSGSFKARIQ